jgi:hypothetical protein
LFYTVIFLENFKRLNHLVAAMWAHSYLAMTHLNAETKELQDYLVPSTGDKVGALHN